MEKMPYQQDLFPQPASRPGNPRPRPREKQTDSDAPVWVQRVSVGILVVFCLYVGLLLFLLPWTRYWQENHYLLTLPSLGPLSLGSLMSSGGMRGVVSGLGLLDIWIGISEIIHYREHRT